MKTSLLLALLLCAFAVVGMGALSLANPSPAYTDFATDLPTYRTVILLLVGLTTGVFAFSALVNRLRTPGIQ